jgi:hypothetical protein
VPTVVGPGDQLVVHDGETVSDVTVLPGGYLLVLSGGTDVRTRNQGGAETVAAGGRSLDAAISDEADMEVFGLASGVTRGGGYVNADAGGTVTGAVINDDVLYVTAAATAANTTVKTPELGAAAGAAVSLGYQSALRLDDSQDFTGTLAGLTAGYQQLLDLGDVPFLAGVTTAQFVEDPSHAQGVLTVSDQAAGGPTAQLTVLGDYGATAFSAAADGATGTAISVGASRAWTPPPPPHTPTPTPTPASSSAFTGLVEVSALTLPAGVPAERIEGLAPGHFATPDDDFVALSAWI